MADDDIEWEDARPIGGMKPWTCSYSKDGKRFAITLYGIDPDQVLEDNCGELDALSVDGELICEGRARPSGEGA